MCIAIQRDLVASRRFSVSNSPKKHTHTLKHQICHQSYSRSFKKPIVRTFRPHHIKYQIPNSDGNFNKTKQLMGFSPEICRRGRNDRRLKSFEPKPRFRDSCHNGVFGARRYLDCRNPCDRMIRRPTKKRRGMCNCPSPCTKWDVTFFFASSFGSERYLCRVHRRFPALCHAQPFFLWNIAIPPSSCGFLAVGWMSEMKNTDKNGYNTIKMWYLHKQIF